MMVYKPIATFGKEYVGYRGPEGVPNSRTDGRAGRAVERIDADALYSVRGT